MRSRRPDERADRVRLFVALDPPPATREALAGWSRAVLASDRSLRLVDAASLHLTIAFLGWRAEEVVEDVSSVALGAAAGLEAPLLTPRALVALPPRGARVVAVDLDDEAGRASSLQAVVARALSGAGLYEPERRPFRPHLTVARVRKGSRPSRKSLPAPPDEPFAARRAVLYRSDPSPEGARYVPLAATALADAP